VDKLKKRQRNFIVEKKDKLFTGILTGNTQEITMLQTVFNSLNNTYYYDDYFIIIYMNKKGGLEHEICLFEK